MAIVHLRPMPYRNVSRAARLDENALLKHHDSTRHDTDLDTEDKSHIHRLPRRILLLNRSQCFGQLAAIGGRQLDSLEKLG